MGIEIRHASPEDVDWLVARVEELARFYDTKRSLFKSPEHSKTVMLNIIAEHLVLIAERAGERLGFIAGYIIRHPWNPDLRMLVENFWWTIPEARKSRANVLLLDAFTAWGRRLVDNIVFNMPVHSPVSERAFDRRGYVLKERAYLLEVP